MAKKSTAKSISPRYLVHAALSRIESDGAFTDIVLSHLFEKQDYPQRDRAFVNHIVRGVVCWKKKLDWIINQVFRGSNDDLPDDIRWILWQGLYQILYMKVPPFAAVNESVTLVRRIKKHRWAGVVNGVLRSYIRSPSQVRLPKKAEDPVGYLSISESHPEWMVRRWIDQFGYETAQNVCRANNTIPMLSVRLNVKQLGRDDFIDLLKQHNAVWYESGIPGFFKIESLDYRVRQMCLENGWITIQDESAGLVGLLVHESAGKVIVDVCAGPGGKSTHLAEMADENTRVISCDVHDHRIGLIKTAAQRLKMSSVLIRADARYVPFKDVDTILLDAPCSGFGVIRKKPDIKWKRNITDLKELHSLQSSMLWEAGRSVRAGGQIIYSTCTIDLDENDRLVEDFTRKNPQFVLVPPSSSVITKEFLSAEGSVKTWPHIHEMDGSFAVKLVNMN